MFQEKFAEIFAELESIENKLKENKSAGAKKEYSQRLLALRQFMDQCIQSWLCFEERVNQLQDNYGLQLPDDVPDLFFKDLDIAELELAAPEKPGPSKAPPKKKKEEEGGGPPPEPPAGYFSKIRKDASISSFKRGLGFYDLSMLEEAIREVENLVNLEPDFIMGHFLLGHVYSHQESHEKAEKEFRLVLALTEEPMLKGMVYNALGNIYAERGKFEQALEEFHLARENSREVREVPFNLAATYYNLSQYQESLPYFKEAARLNPRDWEVYFYLGKACLYLKDYEEALPWLEEARRLNPGNSLVNFELGILYHLLNQREKAISQYIRTLELGKRRGRKKASRPN